LIAALYLSVVEGEPGQLLRLHESGGWSLISLLDSQRLRPDGHKQPFTSYNAKRPRQDSNLRHRLRRAIRFVQPVFSVRSGAAELGLPSTQLVAVFPVAPV